MSASAARLAAAGPEDRGAERGWALLSDRAAERLAVVLAVLAAVAAALAPRRGPVGLADLVLAVAVLGLAPRLRRAPLPVAVAWWATAWVTAAAVSATVALLGRGVERPGLVLLTVLRQGEVVVALALGALAGAARGRDALRGSLLLAVAVAGACGLAQQLRPGIYLPGLSGERAMRSFERGFYVAEANHFAGIFALALPIGLALVAGGAPGPLRRVALVALPLAAAGLATTGSRTGLAAAVAGLLAAVAFSGRRAWLAAGGVALVVAVAFPSGFVRRLQAMADLVTGGTAARSAFGDRAVNWAVAVDGFRAHPLLGLGPGARAMGFYDSELLLALEGGGALGLAALAGFAFSLWLTVRGRERPGETGALVAVLVLGIAMVSLHAARVALPFALILGAALGELSSARR